MSTAIDALREKIQALYKENPPEYWDGRKFRTINADDFGEILCFELHGAVNEALSLEGGFMFKNFAKKWGVTVFFVGELIADHCRKLEE
jgi:hypothetical protein